MSVRLPFLLLVGPTGTARPAQIPPIAVVSRYSNRSLDQARDWVPRVRIRSIGFDPENLRPARWGWSI
jgi:hypothetical protein